MWNAELENPLQEYLRGSPLPPPSEARPEIQYAMFQTAQTIEEQAAAFALAKERMALGLESPITIYLADHPGSTEEEAREAILKNRADTDALKPEPAAPPEPEPAAPPEGGSVPPEVPPDEGDPEAEE